MQDGVVHSSFYWLSVPAEKASARALIVARREGNTITIEKNDSEVLTIGLCDEMIDYKKPVRIVCKGKVIFDKKVPRRQSAIVRSLSERLDPHRVFTTYLTVLDNRKVRID